MIGIGEGRRDVEKIALRNRVCGKIWSKEVRIEEGKSELVEVKGGCVEYCLLRNVIGAFVGCGFLLLMFGGVGWEGWIGWVGGGIGFLRFSLVEKYIEIKLF